MLVSAFCHLVAMIALGLLSVVTSDGWHGVKLLVNIGDGVEAPTVDASLVDQVIADNPDKVADFRSGKDKLMGWFVGQVMQASKGKANPKAVNETLRAKLKV